MTPVTAFLLKRVSVPGVSNPASLVREGEKSKELANLRSPQNTLQHNDL
jgi:cobalamin biosynthesis protein CbiG